MQISQLAVVLISFVVVVIVLHVRLRATVCLAVVGVSLNANHRENSGDHSQADCCVKAIERFRRVSASPF